MKKFTKILAFTLVFVMLLSCGAMSATAADFTVSVSAPVTSTPAGSLLTVTVAVDSISVEEGLLSVDIPLSFDEDVFECVSIKPNYPDNWNVPENFSYTQPVDGVLWLRMLNDDDVFDINAGCAEGGVMSFEVRLKAKSTAALGLTELSVGGDGVFYVISGALADGLCTPVYGTGNSVTVEITERQTEVGDVNGDLRADNLDAAHVLRYDANLLNFDDVQLIAADVNGDGIVNSLDAALILKYDADLITEFPVQQ